MHLGNPDKDHHKEKMLVRLDDRAVIALTGPEARGFLQGLITNDIERLGPSTGLYAALLTPQGKVLHDFFIAEGDGAILIDCLSASRDALIKRLSMYRLRAKVAIESRQQLQVLASWGEERVPHAISFCDPRLDDFGTRSIGAIGEMPADAGPLEAYHSKRLSLGVPEGADFGSDRMFALDADLEELHAISFEKGCYVGQELTARMKHRATARKRLLPIATRSQGPLPPTDTSITVAGREVGELVSAYGTTGFALLRIDRLEENGDVQLHAGDTPVRLIKPAWLFP